MKSLSVVVHVMFENKNVVVWRWWIWCSEQYLNVSELSIESCTHTHTEREREREERERVRYTHTHTHKHTHPLQKCSTQIQYCLVSTILYDTVIEFAVVLPGILSRSMLSGSVGRNMDRCFSGCTHAIAPSIHGFCVMSLPPIFTARGRGVPHTHLSYDRSCTRGMIHNKIHLIIPGCPGPA